MENKQPCNKLMGY